jgi:pyrimidine deaminase RibD-like protein
MYSHAYDQYFMDYAIQQAYKSPPIDTAYCVGAVIVVPRQYVPSSWLSIIQSIDTESMNSQISTNTQNTRIPTSPAGTIVSIPEELMILATGFSRELEGNTHAEECALSKLCADLDKLGSSTEPFKLPQHSCIYTTMEPCTHRLSGKESCTDRLLSAGISRVVIGTPEPNFFVSDCDGIQRLKTQNVEVSVFNDYYDKCLEINRHLLKTNTII